VHCPSEMANLRYWTSCWQIWAFFQETL
jgi:hypothetical protein